MAEKKKKPKAGVSLHKWIAQGGAPKDFRNPNKVK